jgi:hypothetical protein
MNSGGVAKEVATESGLVVKLMMTLSVHHVIATESVCREFIFELRLPILNGKAVFDEKAVQWTRRPFDDLIFLTLVVN